MKSEPLDRTCGTTMYGLSKAVVSASVAGPWEQIWDSSLVGLLKAFASKNTLPCKALVCTIRTFYDMGIACARAIVPLLEVMKTTTARAPSVQQKKLAAAATNINQSFGCI